MNLQNSGFVVFVLTAVETYNFFCKLRVINLLNKFIELLGLLYSF